MITSKELTKDEMINIEIAESRQMLIDLNAFIKSLVRKTIEVKNRIDYLENNSADKISYTYPL